jgi:hypothetical protein
MEAEYSSEIQVFSYKTTRFHTHNYYNLNVGLHTKSFITYENKLYV